MMLETDKEHIYTLALAKWGKKTQAMMFMEEASELIKELSKNLRGEKNVDRIAEEIADVEIMTEQLLSMFDCRSKVLKFKREKLIRLRERVKD